jgi:hypothetical protein
MAIAFELEGDPAGGAGSNSGGREIGARQSVETGKKREEHEFGFDTITGGRTVGEEAAGATAMDSANVAVLGPGWREAATRGRYAA